ncbi:ephrin type-A receptor 4a [Capsaspora owczarzaki ATCC 30864]|uniref:TKL protein kinase n=1 Tax=Capsaspora owczarzaki (strain ATCC 30864) TaxID=595528 RepID=A0A0D2WQR5_CAPO3|nr:ephrin type-A receptor 4a [Capsaspora owczarzaki ATCC 30864]KJE94060.1 TKL protein kinase [Capsaspora owczarzaki ATCC 30864]|eukprot:XP_004347508.1 ephrin type-A receptor 4a [Capsaspora owczarzaki ATCC 30864]
MHKRGAASVSLATLLACLLLFLSSGLVQAYDSQSDSSCNNAKNAGIGSNSNDNNYQSGTLTISGATYNTPFYWTFTSSYSGSVMVVGSGMRFALASSGGNCNGGLFQSYGVSAPGTLSWSVGAGTTYKFVLGGVSGSVSGQSFTLTFKCQGTQYWTGSSCATCNPGSYTDNLSCTPCQSGSTYDDDLNSMSACVPCSGGTCPSTQYLSSSCTTTADRVCTNCNSIGNCQVISCTTSTNQACTTCQTGFYKASATSCPACTSIPNCQTGSVTCNTNSDQQCSTCVSGYYRSTNGATCPQCPAIPFCNSAPTCAAPGTKSTCSACQSNYYKTTGTSSTSDTCTQCTASCPTNQYMTATCSATSDITCSQCAIANCGVPVTCSTSTNAVCTTCAVGTYRKTSSGSNDQCLNCPAVINCGTTTTCDSASTSRCATCNSGFYLQAGNSTAPDQCVPCPAVPGCSVAPTCASASTSKCATCNSGTWKDTSGPADVCRVCDPINACLSTPTCTSYNSSVCTTCAAQMWRSTMANRSDTCESCTPIAGCTSGLQCNSFTTSQCVTCVPGTFLNDGVADMCLGCTPIENCDGSVSPTCNSPTTSRCPTCVYGTWKNTTGPADICQLCTQIDKCGSTVSCGDATSSRCATCLNGYYRKNQGTFDTCETCTPIAGCETNYLACSSPSTSQCFSCEPGTWMNSGSTACTPCSGIIDCLDVRCTDGITSTCQQCANGTYSPDAGASCTTCSQSCGLGMFEQQACAPQQDRVCAACTPVSNCNTTLSCTTSSDSVCGGCIPPLILSSDAHQCIPCPSGQTYQGAQCVLAGSPSSSSAVGTIAGAAGGAAGGLLILLLLLLLVVLPRRRRARQQLKNSPSASDSEAVSMTVNPIGKKRESTANDQSSHYEMLASDTSDIYAEPAQKPKPRSAAASPGLYDNSPAAGAQDNTYDKLNQTEVYAEAAQYAAVAAPKPSDGMLYDNGPSAPSEEAYVEPTSKATSAAPVAAQPDMYDNGKPAQPDMYDNGKPAHTAAASRAPVLAGALYDNSNGRASQIYEEPGKKPSADAEDDNEDMYIYGAPGVADHMPFAVPSRLPDYDNPNSNAQKSFAETVQVLGDLGMGEFGRVVSVSLPRAIFPEKTLKGTTVETPSSDGKVVLAAKMLHDHATPKQRDDFLDEARVMGQFQHPAVVCVIGTHFDTEPVMLLLELFPYGSLQSLLKKSEAAGVVWTAVEQAHALAQIASGMAYLTSQRIVHRDLAARNCLVGHNLVVKVSDFGLSRSMAEDKDYYVVQTRGKLPARWMSPEALGFRKFTEASDVWSFGIVMWEVLTYASASPFAHIQAVAVLEYLSSGGRLERPAVCPDVFDKLMQHCAQQQPSDRPHFTNIVPILARVVSSANTPPRDVGAVVSQASSSSET